MGQAEEDKIAKHFTINDNSSGIYENYPTLYFKNFGPTRFVGGHYKVITYISLQEYNAKYATLGDKIANLSIVCKDLTQE